MRASNERHMVNDLVEVRQLAIRVGDQPVSAEVRQTDVRQAVGQWIVQKVPEAETGSIVSTAGAHLQDLIFGAIITEAKFVKRIGAEVVTDVEDHVLSPHVIVLAVVLDGGWIRGKPIKQIVPERQCSLVA